MKIILNVITDNKLLLSFLFSACCCVNVFAAVATCSGITDGQTHYGTISGVCYAYYCSSGNVTKLGPVTDSYCSSGSCSKGEIQYQPSGTCNTTSRTCCYNGTWSVWGGSCPQPGDDCSSSQCWNGSTCANQPTGLQYNGKCYYTCSSWVCNKGSGWTCTNKVPKKTQKGTWTIWGDVEYSSRPSSTCSYRATSYLSPSSYSPSDSLAITICDKHINGNQGTPDGTSTWTGSCTVIGNCWTSDRGGYKCQNRTVKCTEESATC